MMGGIPGMGGIKGALIFAPLAVGPADDQSVIELQHGPQVAEKQEFPQVDAKADGVLRHFGQGQDFDAVQPAGFVGRGVPPVHSGIN